jgi:hypothetical protein
MILRISPKLKPIQDGSYTSWGGEMELKDLRSSEYPLPGLDMSTLLSELSPPLVSVKSSNFFFRLKTRCRILDSHILKLNIRTEQQYLRCWLCRCTFVNKLSVQETIFKSGLSTRLTEYGGEIVCTGVLITFIWFNIQEIVCIKITHTIRHWFFLPCAFTVLIIQADRIMGWQRIFRWWKALNLLSMVSNILLRKMP